MWNLESDWDKAGSQISSCSVLDWGGFLGLFSFSAECWEVVNKLLHIWRKDMNSNVNLKEEICLRSIVLAWDKDTGLCTQLCQGLCSILGSCKTCDVCVSVFPPLLSRIALGQSWVYKSALDKRLQPSYKSCTVHNELFMREGTILQHQIHAVSAVMGLHLANARDSFFTMGWQEQSCCAELRT